MLTDISNNLATWPTTVSACRPSSRTAVSDQRQPVRKVPRTLSCNPVLQLGTRVRVAGTQKIFTQVVTDHCSPSTLAVNGPRVFQNTDCRDGITLLHP